jgi:PTH1 family peptidyl-tRNA hydrolase
LKVLVGLGNPGAKYESTRHNAGFIVLDEIASRIGASWSKDSRFSAETCRGKVCDYDCILVKPQTFMNLSGRSVGPLCRFFRVEDSDVVVMHDDIDVPSGKVKARIGGGSGGNNGIKSLLGEGGLKDFHRIKLGVGKPTVESKIPVHDWVLGRFTDQEMTALRNETVDAVMLRLAGIFRNNGPTDV